MMVIVMKLLQAHHSVHCREWQKGCALQDQVGPHLPHGQAARLPPNPPLHSSTPPPADPLCPPHSAKHRSRVGSTHPSSTLHKCMGTSRPECHALLVLVSPGQCLQVCTADCIRIPCTSALQDCSHAKYPCVIHDWTAYWSEGYYITSTMQPPAYITNIAHMPCQPML